MESIPQCLKYGDYVTQKDFIDTETPVQNWIKYRKLETIPNDLKYSGWMNDCNIEDNGQCIVYNCPRPIIYWIQYRQNESIPQELMDNEEIYAIANVLRLIFIWRKYRPTERLPPEFVYENWEKD